MYNIFIADALIDSHSAAIERSHTLRNIERSDAAHACGRHSVRRAVASTAFFHRTRGRA